MDIIISFSFLNKNTVIWLYVSSQAVGVLFFGGHRMKCLDNNPILLFKRSFLPAASRTFKTSFKLIKGPTSIRGFWSSKEFRSGVMLSDY